MVEGRPRAGRGSWTRPDKVGQHSATPWSASEPSGRGTHESIQDGRWLVGTCSQDQHLPDGDPADITWRNQSSLDGEHWP